MPEVESAVLQTDASAVCDQNSMPLVSAVISFLRRSPVFIAITSVAILIPCYWHQYIESCDLSSHTYNAWLAALIEQGKAPGLRIAQQWQNILFDYMLYGLTRTFGFVAGEKIAVSLCVLVFFWGAFALVSVASGRAGWRVTPILAMLAYGWVFHMGFMNLYLSIGLLCIALALLWRGNRREKMLAIPVVILVLFAHVLGFALLICAAAYVLAGDRIKGRAQLILPIVSLLVFFIGRFYVVHHIQLMAKEWPIYWMGGADQFMLYRPEYKWISYVIIGIFVLQCLMAIIKSRLGVIAGSETAISLYVVAAIALYFSPGGIWPSHSVASMGFLPDRVSLFVAVLGCCVLARLHPHWFVVGGFVCVAVVQFGFIFRDTRAINDTERNVYAAVRALPPGERVIGSFFIPKSRVQIDHIIDRACIGHCFSYANYEPSSDQFRIRATPGNEFVTTSSDDSRRMQVGTYIVQGSDPKPLFQVYNCVPKQNKICVRELAVGERNGNGMHVTSLDLK